MKRRILGATGVLWGGTLVVGHLIDGAGIDYSSAYSAGQSTGLILGALMFLAGATSLIKSFRRSA